MSVIAKEREPGAPVLVYGVVTGQHHGQTVVEFAGPDGPITWHLTNGVTTFDGLSPSDANIVIDTMQQLIAKQAKRIKDGLRMVASLEQELGDKTDRGYPARDGEAF